ncbi:hypothetical protein M433DRAFT_10501, partial [Acidomyces richmondensis BFW]
MAPRGHARFADESAQVEDSSDLERANEKLEEEVEEDRSSQDEVHPANEAASGDGVGRPLEKLGTYDKYEITEDDCYDELGYSFSTVKKYYILTVIFAVQVSMNFNTSLYSNAIGGISKQFHVSEQAARVGAAIFLVFYAFGCELWAPW